MVIYVLLLLILSVLWVISFKISDWNLMSPVPLMLLGLVVSVLLAIIGVSSWNHIDLQWDVFSVILIGSVSLLLGAMFCNMVLYRHAMEPSKGTDGNYHSSAYWKYALVAVILIAAILIRVSETFEIAAELGVVDAPYSEAARVVRGTLAGFNSSAGMRAGVGFSLVERQLEKFATATGFVTVYLFARALLNKDLKAGGASMLLVLLSCIFCFITGSRGPILYYGIAFTVCLFVLMRRNASSSRTISLRFLVIGALISCGVAAAFYLSGAVVGRSANSGVVEYISFYYGCGIPAFQSILDSGNIAELVPGVRTFYYLFSVPFKLGLIENYPSYSVAWVDMGGHACNIFSGFARYYLDFGFIGTALLSFVAGAFMTYLFRLASQTTIPVLMVLIGYLGAYAFDFAREEFIFSRLFSPTQFISVLIMVIITLFLTTSLRRDLHQIGAFFAKKADS